MKKNFPLWTIISVVAVAVFFACGDDADTASANGVSSDSTDPTNSSSVESQSFANTNSSSAESLSSANTDSSSSSVESLSSTNSDQSSSSSADLTGSSSSTATSSVSVDNYSVPTLTNLVSSGDTSQSGWSSRYWDACKPSCSWPGNVDTTSEATYQAGYTTAKNCNINDIEVPTFTLSHNIQQYWMGYEGTPSACGSGSAGVFTCTDMAPIEVNDTLSYGYVAGPGSTSAGACGKCFHIQFNGGNHDGNIKAAHDSLAGKHMIVMESNIGYDVDEGQFDLMVPGGGVGQYDALSTMVSGSSVNWGAQYGGFLSECQSSLGYDASVASYQSCIKDMCTDAFADYPNLLRGCNWFADWYMAADNPTYYWEEVDCPQYLIDQYMTSINTTKTTNILYQSDWSTYTGGEFESAPEGDCVCNDEQCGCSSCTGTTCSF